jgi:hypothetical protein
VTIILDTNLLLLFVVGTASRKYISMHKKLKSYTNDDFDLLVNLLYTANNIVVTPNTLTETSNLAAYISDPALTHIFTIFRLLMTSNVTTERFVQSDVAAARPEFIRLGLTDAALLHIADDSHILLTADVDLYLAALNDGKNAQNFNHLRNI